MENIQQLLNKYFEGETSSAEEKELRQFFASAEVPEHLMMYKPLFAYFDEEILKEEASSEGIDKQLGEIIIPSVEKKVIPQHRIILRWVSGVAAAVLLLLGVGQLFIFPDRAYCSGNYVVINGRCYTDIHKVREHALNALQEVSDTDRELFPVMDDEDIDREIIENQFRELGNFFSDDE